MADNVETVPAQKLVIEIVWDAVLSRQATQDVTHLIHHTIKDDLRHIGIGARILKAELTLCNRIDRV